MTDYDSTLVDISKNLKEIALQLTVLNEKLNNFTYNDCLSVYQMNKQ
jgi:hypothetical protein